MTAGLVKRWLAAGELSLPLPGGGNTAQRWRRLSELTALDVVAGRLGEAHADAVAILDELDGPAPGADQLWGVWAADPPDATVLAFATKGGAVLDGTKAWCSGAGLCARALVTATLDGDRRGLFAVDMGDERVRPLPSTWRNPGVADSDTRSVQFTAVPAVPAVPVGRPGDYLQRPGFWFGAIGVAACWLGGARAVAAPLYQRAANGVADARRSGVPGSKCQRPGRAGGGSPR